MRASLTTANRNAIRTEKKNKMNETIKTETLETEFVSPETCVFFEAANGFLGVTLNGTRYGRVILTRALPLSAPDSYISISDVDKNELGIIRSVADFSETQQTLIKNELSVRYYCPVLSGIESIKEKMGHFYFDVTIGGKKKSFTVRDISKSIRMNDKHVDITDMDGNRYRINDLSAIPKKSRRMLEPYIY